MAPHPTDISLIEAKTTGVETPKALLVEIDNNEVWIPKSLIEEERPHPNDPDKILLSLPLWFIDQEGL